MASRVRMPMPGVHFAYGNYASANVQMVNSGTGKITSSGGDGIDGRAVAKANAYGVKVADGGTDPAIAITSISNGGSIVAAVNGIYGGARPMPMALPPLATAPAAMPLRARRLSTPAV